MKIRNLIKNELSGWRLWEIIWLAVATLTIIGLSVYWQDTLMGIISSTAGVMCVVCTGKGKLSAYFFGFINSLLYSIIAFRAAYYGETMLNLLYYVPTQFIGFYVWAKNMNPETNEVKKVHMKPLNFLFWVAVIAVGTVLYGHVLKFLNDAMPFVDSFTTVASIVATVISIKMYVEQWWIWIGINIFTIYMWWIDFSTGNDNVATLVMWMVFLVNAVIMLIRWNLEAKKEAEK